MLGRSKWAKLAAEIDDEPSGELLADERALAPLSAFDVPLSETSVLPSGSTWSQPPKRGLRELMAAYVVSPYLRATVARVVESYGAVEWFVPGPDQTKDFTHPAVQLINDYNPLLTGSQGRELEQTYLEVPGESITVIAPSSSPKRVDLFPVPPNRVNVESVRGEQQFRVSTQGGDFVFAADEVIYQRTIDPLNPYGRGAGLGLATADEIETDEYVAKHVKAYYFNSTVPEFIGVLPNANDKKLKAWQQQWDNHHRGFRRHWRPVWINQEVDFKELQRELNDEQIQRLRKLAFDTIRWVYGVPPEIMGVVENSNRATIQAAMQIMAAFVIEPRLRKKRSLYRKLSQAIWGVDVDFISPIQREFDRRDEIMSRHPYAFTRNEIRREAGFDPVPDGNVYLVPVNIDTVPVGDSANDEPVLMLVDETETDGTDAA